MEMGARIPRLEAEQVSKVPGCGTAVSRLPLRHRQVVKRVGIAGLELKNQPQGSRRILEVAEKDERLRQQVARLPPLRLQLHCLLEFPNGLAKMPVLSKRDAESGVGDG